MSLFVVNPYAFAAAPGGDPNRTILTLASTITAVPLALTTIDNWSASANGLGAYDAGDPSRLTVPSDGYYVAYACIAVDNVTASDDSHSIYIGINGSFSALGRAREEGGAGSSSTPAGRMCQTAILYCTAGTYFEMAVLLDRGDEDLVHNDTMPTLFMLYKVPSAIKAAVAQLTADDTAVNGTYNVLWDAQVYDTDSMWPGASNDRFNIPSGPTRASVTSNIAANLVTITNFYGNAARKNGTFFAGAFNCEARVTSPSKSLYSGPIAVTSSDYVSCGVLTTDTSYTVLADRSSGGVEAHSRICAVATRSSSVTGVNMTSGYTVPWNNEELDDAGIYDAGANTRLTSPGGWVQVGATIRLANYATALGSFFVQIVHKNSSGTTLAEYRCGNTRGATTVYGQAYTPQVETAAGDYFECVVRNTGDTSIDLLLDSRFWMEVYPS